ncbi:MAG: cytidylate kinase [Pseudomonadota bacterium]|jgi:cytidylate kinase
MLDKLLNFDMPIVVAIDGTAASGKGTLAKLLSERFNLEYCQSSLFYRQLAYDVLEKNIDTTNDHAAIIELSKKPITIAEDHTRLYSPLVTKTSSVIAAIPEVRENLSKSMKNTLNSHKRIVMEGRDITTQIAPDADIKLFVNADLTTRAQRRYTQMQKSGNNASLEEIEKDIKDRDYRDMNREAAPLIKAEDAIEIDTATMNPEEIIDWLLEVIQQ